jgi:predicted transcriptional regulator
MSDSANARLGLTVRLDPPTQERVRKIAESEHRSVSAYLEQLIERDLAARDEAERVVRVFIDPDLGGADQGDVAREDGEDGGRHARRAATLDRLFGKGG